MNLENLSVTVAYVKQGDISGTGFFVNSTRPRLVTASHVAAVLTPKSTLTIRMSDDRPASLIFEELFPGLSELPWQRHPEADVATLPMPLSEKIAPLFRGRFLPLKMLQSEEKSPQRERPLVVMGFPLALGTTGRFSPITSEAKPASGLLRLPRFDTGQEATFFLLDKPSVGGFSGAPVFLMPGPYAEDDALVFPEAGTPAMCVGLVHGTISDNTGGKFAAVVPAHFILETIALAD